MEKFNEWLALKITKGVSTMTCAYFFAALAIFGFPYGSHAIKDYVQWLSQTFIQLTMLSIIMVGQNIMSKSHDEHAQRTEDLHDKLDALMKE